MPDLQGSDSEVSRMTVIAHSIYVCDICGQRLAGADSRCNSGLHQGPDDPNGWRGKAVEYLPAAAYRGAVEAYQEASNDADVASMQAAFWRKRAIELGADESEWRRFATGGQ